MRMVAHGEAMEAVEVLSGSLQRKHTLIHLIVTSHPAVYVAESAISLGTAGSSADGDHKRLFKPQLQVSLNQLHRFSKKHLTYRPRLRSNPNFSYNLPRRIGAMSMRIQSWFTTSKFSFIL